MMFKCVYNSPRNDGSLMEEGWKDFDVFYKDNYRKYYRAKRKWKNYRRLTGDVGAELKVNPVHLIRKIPDKGFFVKNLVFTSVADKMKYFKSSKNIFLDNKRLGTRDVKNLLKKRGINLTITNIALRINEGRSVFGINRLKKWKWKGLYFSLEEIAVKENVKYTLLQNRVFIQGEPLGKAIIYCKNWVKTLYDYEGKMLTPTEIIRILSKKYNIPEITLCHRFYSWGYDVDRITKKSENKFVPYKKPIVVKKGNTEVVFDSTLATSKALNISVAQITNVVRGVGNHVNGYKGYYVRLKTDDDNDIPSYNPLDFPDFIEEKDTSGLRLHRHNYKTAIIKDGKVVEKKCKDCGEVKPIKEFFQNGSNQCRACRKAIKNKIYRENHEMKPRAFFVLHDIDTGKEKKYRGDRNKNCPLSRATLKKYANTDKICRPYRGNRKKGCYIVTQHFVFLEGEGVQEFTE